MSLYINICICKVHNMLRTSLNIKRDLTVSCASRVMTGPDVVGCRCRQLHSVCPGPDNIFRPVVVTFEEFKDREEVLRKAGVLKGNNIHVTEDMSRSHTVSSRTLFHPLFIIFQTCTREPHRAEEVHARREEAEPGGQHSAAVRQAVRQPPLLRLERLPGEGGGVHPGK